MGTINPEVDFYHYYARGLDPDSKSRRLNEWHRTLWSRFVPGVPTFEIEVIGYAGSFELLLRAPDREIRLASDGIIQDWANWASYLSSDVVEEIRRDVDEFSRTSSTIGAYIVFPRNGPQQDGWTINQARGVRYPFADRFDLALESIRRHYEERDSYNPLGKRLSHYADFFDLFGDFKTYVRFFLLDDLVSEDCGAVLSLFDGLPLTQFPEIPLPATAEEFAGYRRHATAFVQARNGRIARLVL